jgi:very-long-chain (3R)-3-hydroxyacyl-CoA dehydratase
MENKTQRPTSAPSNLTKRYLLAYNLICFILWSTLTLRAALLIPVLSSHGRLEGLLPALYPLLKWAQTLALLEITHAAFGLVRAGLLTTMLQVASRILVVWLILGQYPEIVATRTAWGSETAGSTTGPIALAGILMAWGITEIIRYGFFVWKTDISEQVPAALTWLRYNTFFVLYPIGITSECLLIYLATKPAAKEGLGIDWFLKAVLLIYIPGSYILYTHMMSQRRKVMKGKGKTA